MPTVTPLNEEERLAVLRECRILDTEPERAFDDIAALAAHLCDVPIALVSLIDETRQWSKAAFGIERGETPREMAFCNRAIEGGESFEVTNAARDPRFAANPLVTGEPHIRYYFGVPLRVEGGHALGTLCLVDRKPRRFHASEFELIRGLARLAVDQLEERRRTSRLLEALESANTLERLLPMCAGCKKVREGEGYWRRVEEFLQRFGARVTHGFCPPCEEKMLREM